MLVRIEKNATTINLDRFDCVRAVGKCVEAVSGICTIRIATCETENDARALEKIIFEYWVSPCNSFSVDKWCEKNNVAFD